MKLFPFPFFPALVALSAVSAGTAQSAVILDDGAPFDFAFTSPVVYTSGGSFDSVGTFTVVFEDVYATDSEVSTLVPEDGSGVNSDTISVSDTITIQKNDETPLTTTVISYIAGLFDGDPSRDVEIEFILSTPQLLSLSAGDTITISGGAIFALIPTFTSLGDTVNTRLLTTTGNIFADPTVGSATLDVVPEPSSTALIISAMSLVCLKRRRS